MTQEKIKEASSVRTTFPEVLGKGITHWRKKQNLKQADVAEAVGVSQSAYSRIEKGKSNLSVIQLRRIGHCLDMSAAEMLSEVEAAISRLRAKGILVQDEDSKADSSNGLLWLAGAALVGAFAASVAQQDEDGDDD